MNQESVKKSIEKKGGCSQLAPITGSASSSRQDFTYFPKHCVIPNPRNREKGKGQFGIRWTRLLKSTDRELVDNHRMRLSNILLAPYLRSNMKRHSTRLSKSTDRDVDSEHSPPNTLFIHNVLVSRHTHREWAGGRRCVPPTLLRPVSVANPLPPVKVN